MTRVFLAVLAALGSALAGCGYSSPLLYRSAGAAERAVIGLPAGRRLVVVHARCFIGPQQCEARLSNGSLADCVVGLSIDERRVRSLVCAHYTPGVRLF